jgi:hypothetical protein
MTNEPISFNHLKPNTTVHGENFEIIRSDVLRANYGTNPWQEKNQVITSISWVSRIGDANDSLLYTLDLE